MNEQLLQAVDFLVKEKNVPEDIIFNALETVLLTAYKRETGSNANTSVTIDRKTGDYHIYAEKNVVETVDPDSENASNEISLEEAKKVHSSYEAGDILQTEVTPKNFGRMAAQTAKQVMIQN